MTKKTDEDKRLRDIQNHLVKHIEKEIQDEDDFMYMATMLLKHSMVVYKRQDSRRGRFYVYGHDVTQTQHGSIQNISVR